ARSPARRRRGRQGGEHRAERGYFIAAHMAALEVAHVRARLMGLQCTEQVRRRVEAAVAARGHLVHAAHAGTPSGAPRASRSLLKPSRIRPLTVPAGTPSAAAICAWEKPP